MRCFQKTSFTDSCVAANCLHRLPPAISWCVPQRVPRRGALKGVPSDVGVPHPPPNRGRPEHPLSLDELRIFFWSPPVAEGRGQVVPRRQATAIGRTHGAGGVGPSRQRPKRQLGGAPAPASWGQFSTEANGAAGAWAQVGPICRDARSGGGTAPLRLRPPSEACL